MSGPTGSVCMCVCMKEAYDHINTAREGVWSRDSFRGPCLPLEADSTT